MAKENVFPAKKENRIIMHQGDVKWQKNVLLSLRIFSDRVEGPPEAEENQLTSVFASFFSCCKSWTETIWNVKRNFQAFGTWFWFRYLISIQFKYLITNLNFCVFSVKIFFSRLLSKSKNGFHTSCEKKYEEDVYKAIHRSFYNVFV